MKKILQHGLNKIQAKHNSEVNIELQGATLLPMTNSILHKDKYYVLANEDKKTSVIQDNVTYNGVAKFKGSDDRITLKRKINFSNKISGSISTNPHVMKKGGVSNLQLPSSSELQEVEQNFYNNINSYDLGSTSHTYTTSAVNKLSQITISIDLISEIEKHLGKIPYSSLSAKREWVKVNIDDIVLTYSGLQAKINVLNPNDNIYADSTRYDHNATIMKKYSYRLTSDANTTPRLIKDLIDPNGFIHFTVYGNEATSTSPSNLIIDLLEIEFSLKKDSNLQVPRVPLYEVTSEEYEKILYQWDEKKVCAIFPPVDGLQSLTAPYFKNESNPNVELFADVILRGMYGISDTLRRREGKWNLVKEWEQIDLAIVENQAPFNIKFRDYILLMDKSDKKVITDFTIGNGYLRIPSMISGTVTIMYRLPKTSITNVDHKVYGEMLVFGDSDIVVDADGDIAFNSIQNKYEYKRANRETKYPKKPNVKSAIASYRQLYDIALDGLSLRDQSHFDSVDNMKLLIGQLKDELELLKLQNQEMLKMIYKNSNN